MVFVGLRATQNGLEGEVMEVCNSLTFGKLYGGTAAQQAPIPIFGADNGDRRFSPYFCWQTGVWSENSVKFCNFFNFFLKKFDFQGFPLFTAKQLSCIISREQMDPHFILVRTEKYKHVYIFKLWRFFAGPVGGFGR